MKVANVFDGSYEEFYYETPIFLIEKFLKELDERDKKLAKYHSITLAKIGAGFGENIDPNKLLPFYEDSPKVSQSNHEMSDECVKLLKKLIRRKELPKHIYPTLEKWSDKIFN